MVDRQLDVQYAPMYVTTQPATLAAAPQSTPVQLGDVELVAVELRIPPGHQGFTGVSVQLGGVSLLPWGTPPVWVIGDDDELSFSVGMEVDTGLSVVTYNTGQFPHTHYMRFVWRTLGARVQSPPALTLVPLGELNVG